MQSSSSNSSCAENEALKTLDIHDKVDVSPSTELLSQGSEMFDALCKAINEGNIDSVYSLLANITDIDEKNKAGKSFLHVAAESGNVKITLLLIEAGCLLNTPDKEGNTPLDIAVLANHVEVAKTILDCNGVSFRRATFLPSATGLSCEIFQLLLSGFYGINSVNERGQTALHTALELGRDDIVEILLEGGADVNQTCLEGKSPLHYAVKNSILTIVKKLLVKGAIVEISDIFGLTPLHLASQIGKSDMVIFLLQSGANANSTSLGGFTPLHFASICNHITTARALLEAGANINSATKAGQTPFSFSLILGYNLMLNELMKYGPSFQCDVKYLPLNLAAANGQESIIGNLLKISTTGIDEKDKDGKTPLFLASEKGYLNVVKMLLIFQTSLNISCTTKNRTPLHVAVLNRHSQVVSILLGAGADVHSKDSEGNCPIHLAIQQGHLDVLNEFIYSKNSQINLKNNNGYSPIHIACLNNNLDMLNILRKNGANLKEKDGSGNYIIHLAAKLGHLKILSSLSDVFSVKDVGEVGRTPLHIAASENHPDIIEYLINKGANINAQDTNGMTALHLATKGAHIASIKVLLNNLADLEVRTDSVKNDNYGQMKYPCETALHLATSIKDDELVKTVIKMLLKAGANIEAMDYTNRTPLCWAVMNGLLKSTELLLKYGANFQQGYNGISSNAANKKELRSLLEKYSLKRNNR